MSSTPTGIALACTSATMNAVGLNVQRLGTRRGSPLCTAFGVIMCACCGPMDMISFTYAPQSLLAPFGATSLVINLLLAPVLHGDDIAHVDILATALVFLGVVTCLANATISSTAHTFDQLGALAARPPFMLWVLLLCSAIGSNGLRLYRKGLRHPTSAALLPLTAGLVGSCTVLGAKVLIECLAADDTPWPAALALGLCVACCGVAQTVLLNLGIGRHSSLVVVPYFVAAFVSGNAFGGGVFFREFEAFDGAQVYESCHHAQGRGNDAIVV